MPKINVRADVLLRALAIITVTYNHAHPYSTSPLGWGGGMPFLLLLSGYNFAKFGVRGSTAEEVRAKLIHLGWRILVPSFAVVVFFFVLLQKFDLSELLFYRNWLSAERISKFPTWYPQVVVQLFIALYLLFSVPVVARSVLRWPAQSAFCLFVAGLLVRLFFPGVWDTAPLHHHLPHLFLWNFALGWLVYFSVTELRSPWGKWLAIACTAIGAFSVFGTHLLDFWWLTIGVILLTLPFNVRLPAILGRFLILVSQGTFAIFLLHRFFYEVYEHLALPQQDDTIWVTGLLGSLFAWLCGSAAVRAFRTIQRRGMTVAATSG